VRKQRRYDDGGALEKLRRYGVAEGPAKQQRASIYFCEIKGCRRIGRDLGRIDPEELVHGYV
jgi:hypothetical protein